MNTNLPALPAAPETINLTIFNALCKELNDVMHKVDTSPMITNDERVVMLSKAQGLLFTTSGEALALLTEVGKIIGGLSNPNADLKTIGEYEKLLVSTVKDRN
jgi:hypothetical protein